MNPDKGQTLNWFLIDQEVPVSELVELATAKWLAAQSFGSDQKYRRDLAILADQLLEHARKTHECWTLASRCAASRTLTTKGLRKH
jgi:hypothetical protein